MRWWCKGRGHHDPAIRDRLHADFDVRWGDLLSLFFLAQLREHGVDLDSIRNYVDRMQRESEDLYPLAPEGGLRQWVEGRLACGRRLRGHHGPCVR